MSQSRPSNDSTSTHHYGVAFFALSAQSGMMNPANVFFWAANGLGSGLLGVLPSQLSICSPARMTSFLRTSLLCSILCVATIHAPASAAPPAHPNIVVVMPDDVGYGDFSCHGNPVINTPVIDSLWRESVRFTDFHVSPTCSPTRAALMTGRHEFKNGVTHTIFERERLTLKATTMAQALKRQGYRTGIFGKWHLGDEPAYQPNKRGFDEVFIHGGGGIGQTYPGSCGDAPGNTYFNPAILHNGKFVKTQGYCTDLFFQEAVSWIDSKRQGSAPFFASIMLNAAHAPLQCPEDYFKRYQGKVPDDAAKFFGMIENIDDNMGRLLKKLKEWGLEENTLLIFLTDNGGTVGTRLFNAGMRGGKASPYQGATRVPSFWRWPAGFKGGLDCPALAAHVDVLPTLLEILGVKVHRQLKDQIEGRSLLPLLKNPDAHSTWPDRVLVTHVGRWPKGKIDAAKYANMSLRNQHFTLVNNGELYNLSEDPGETKNVIQDHPEVVTRLRTQYDEWWRDVQPMLVNENVTGPKTNPFKTRYWKQFGGPK